MFGCFLFSLGIFFVIKDVNKIRNKKELTFPTSTPMVQIQNVCSPEEKQQLANAVLNNVIAEIMQEVKNKGEISINDKDGNVIMVLVEKVTEYEEIKY